MSKPYEEGFRAYARGEPMTENPYPDFTDVHGQWNDGWRIQTAGYKSVISDETDVRWAVNVLLEEIAARFEAWETMDLWRSAAADTVRSFKHNL
jgi:hypothetical protein